MSAGTAHAWATLGTAGLAAAKLANLIVAEFFL